MLTELSKYEVIILDGFGTLYDKDLLPLPGAIDLLHSVSNKSILFSNVGSMTGNQLRSRLASKFINLPNKIMTSLDILMQYLKRNNLKDIYHFGGLKTSELLTSNGISVVPFSDDADVIVFSSLPSENWIQDSQSVLRLINNLKVTQLILSNPDRLLSGDHVGINVGMMFDMLVNSWPNDVIGTFNILELGKPKLNKLDFDINGKKNILVIGDNYITDGGLAQNLDCDFNLISKNNTIESKQMKVYRSLTDMINYD